MIQVENLGKRYRIGRRRDKQGLAMLTNPFQHLLDSIREPAPEEVLWSLRGVGFEVGQGEVVGIIGRNGAGKSTLLKILSRITEPTEGQAIIRGRVGSLLEVGTGFHPELTGRENIYLSGTILGLKKREIDRSFDEIVAFAEIDRFLDTQVKRYSSGMYVRLAFAVAAHLEPEVLLIDEVLAVGDARFQEKCLEKMSRVAGGGRTILFVSHNLTAVQSLCPRSIFLDQGRLKAIGPTEEIVRQYLGHDVVDSVGQRIWMHSSSAPGCGRMWLESVRVLDDQGRTSSSVPISRPFDIEVTYRTRGERIRAGLTIVLYRDGQLVLSSISNTDTEWHSRLKEEGRYRSRCRIPGDLLNDGRHEISLILWTGSYSLCAREDRVLSFFVQDTGETRGDYFGGWSGAVRPLLTWRTEPVDEV